MNLDLFDSGEVQHDPGGKVRLRLQGGVVGTALFSPCRKHRLVLTRDWGEGPSVLWIGANPSTAEADVDDPTIRREVNFTRGWGFCRYIKMNVLSYRATYPKDLLADGVEVTCPENLPTIVTMAATAKLIVVCHGVLHPTLQHHAGVIVMALCSKGHGLHCLGRNADGSPKHPLYLPKTAALEPYP